jgi:hypothetical protein
MGHSTAPPAYIAIIVEPFFFTLPGRESDPISKLPPAAAAVYLAAHFTVRTLSQAGTSRRAIRALGATERDGGLELRRN